MKQGAYQFFLGTSIYFCCLVTTNSTTAQIIPDATLPVNSTVKLTGDISTIDDGTRAGSNLFHSFEQFSVVTGKTVLFNNALDIQNIITRVTGSSVSNIDGLIKAKGTANLFLLNPNGIILGPNARLDIGGSFLATTANSLNFADGTQFNAKAVQTTPLLTISVPIGLQYGGNAGGISVQQSRLEVRTGKTLALVGGNVQLDGGSLATLGGRVELGGVAGTGTVALNFNDKNLSLSFPNDLARTDISLNNGVSIDVRTNFFITDKPISLDTIELAGDGSIVINARNLSILGESELKAGVSTPLGDVLEFVTQAKGLDILKDLPSLSGADYRELFAGIRGLGTDGIQAGDITVNATGRITINRANLVNATDNYSFGNSGNINIQGGSITISDRAQLITSTKGFGNAGSIAVQANDSIFFANSYISSTIEPGAEGNSGSLIIKGQSLSANDGTQLEVSNGSGLGQLGNVNIDVRENVTFSGSRVETLFAPNVSSEGGNINVAAGALLLTDGSTLSTYIADAGFEPTGSVNINTRENVFLDNSSISTEVYGGFGQITINTRTLSLANDARLSANLSGGLISSSGQIKIDATDAVSISGGGLFATSGSIFGSAGNIYINTPTLRLSDGAVLDARAKGQVFAGAIFAGAIFINANTFEVTNGSQLVTTTLASGSAGDIILNVSDRITVEGSKSGLFTNTDRDSTGAGGNLIINTGQLFLRQGAQASASSDGTGAAGNLQVTARSLQLDSSGLSATTTAGDRGNITIQSENLQMRHNSNITTNASNTANGGNITIDTEVLAALEDSDIRANAVRGDGGRVNITAQGVFGTEYRAAETSESDITASSTFGRQGEVTLNTPDTDPSRGLIGLPEIPVDPTRLIAQGCPADKSSRFSITGRGGLPLNPREAIGTDNVVVNWVTLESEGENISTSAISTSATRSIPTPSIEAQGFQRYSNGDVLLTATSPTVTPYSSLSTPVSCYER